MTSARERAWAIVATANSAGAASPIVASARLQRGDKAGASAIAPIPGQDRSDGARIFELRLQNGGLRGKRQPMGT